MKKIICLLIIQITAIQLQAQKLGWNGNVTPNGATTRTVMKDNSGNYYITGNSLVTCDFDFGPGVANVTPSSAQQAYISKYDAGGNLIWAVPTGGYGVEYGFLDTVNSAIYISGFVLSAYGTIDFDGGPGVSNATVAGATDYFVSKFDLNGNFLWKITGGGNGTPWQFYNMDDIYAVKTDVSGNVYVAGTFRDTIDLDPGPGNYTLMTGDSVIMFLAKFNTNGNFIWGKTFGYGKPEDIDFDPAGYFYFSGTIYDTVDFDPGTGTVNLIGDTLGSFFIAKYDTAGNLIRAFTNEGSGSAYMKALHFYPPNLLYLVGGFTGTIDLDPSAAVSGLTSSAYGSALLAVYDTSGNLQWNLKLSNGTGSSSYCDLEDISIDNAGNFCVAGLFGGTNDFDPGAGNYSFTAWNAKDAFIAKYDPVGNLIFAKKFGTQYPLAGGDDKALGVLLENSGVIYTCGIHKNNFDVDPGIGVKLFSASANGAGWVAQLCPSNLTGTVSYSGGTVNNGFAKMYYNRYGQKMELMDSVSINASGQFVFNNVGDDSITIYVRSNTPGTIGTYYGDTCAWIPGDSSIINCGNNNISIMLNEVPAMTGSGTVSGQITQGLNFGKFNMLATPGSPIGGIDVGIRKKPTGNIVGMTQTDVSGNYSFTNIDPGNYSLYVDIPGLPMDSTYDFTISGNENIQGMNFIGDSTSIYINSGVGIKEQGNALNSVIVYPNPASGVLNIVSKDETIEKVFLYSVLGQKVIQLENIQQKEIQVKTDQLHSGVYTCLVQCKENYRQFKIIIK